MLRQLVVDGRVKSAPRLDHAHRPAVHHQQRHEQRQQQEMKVEQTRRRQRDGGARRRRAATRTSTPRRRHRRTLQQLMPARARRAPALDDVGYRLNEPLGVENGRDVFNLLISLAPRATHRNFSARCEPAAKSRYVARHVKSPVVGIYGIYRQSLMTELND